MDAVDATSDLDDLGPDLADMPDALDVPDTLDASDAPAVLDALDAPDAPDVLDPSIAPPRPLAPLSVFVTTERPILRWVLATGTDGARVELCRERTCTAVVHDLRVAASEVQTPVLARGAWFWRLYGRAGATSGTRASATWEFVARPRSERGSDGGVDGGAEGSSVASPIPDFNGDGLADLALPSPSDGSDAGVGGRVYIYPGVATGVAPALGTTLLPPETGVDFGCGAASIGDLNGDGFADLAVAGGGRAIYVYAGGSGGLSASPVRAFRAPSSGSFHCDVSAIGDYDRDGFADLAVSGASNTEGRYGVVWQALSARLGAAGIEPESAGTFRTASGFGDFDGDGTAELVVGGHTGLELQPSFYVRTMAGGMETTRELLPTTTYHDPFLPYAVLDDLNGDGRTDLLRASSSDAGVLLYTHLGSAAGLPTMATESHGEPSSSYLAGAGDFDGDGAADYVRGPAPSSRVVFATGSTAYLNAVDAPAVAVGVGDLNGDNLDDVVSASTSAVRVYLGRRMSSGIAGLTAAFTLTPPTPPDPGFGSMIVRGY